MHSAEQTICFGFDWYTYIYISSVKCKWIQFHSIIIICRAHTPKVTSTGCQMTSRHTHMRVRPLNSNEKYKNDTHQFHEMCHRMFNFRKIFAHTDGRTEGILHWFICKMAPLHQVGAHFYFAIRKIYFSHHKFYTVWKCLRVLCSCAYVCYKKRQSHILFILCPNLSKKIFIFTNLCFSSNFLIFF